MYAGRDFEGQRAEVRTGQPAADPVLRGYLWTNKKRSLRRAPQSAANGASGSLHLIVIARREMLNIPGRGRTGEF